MCTLSWFATADGYEVFFNRDERRSRMPSGPPEVRVRGDTRFIAPRDGDFGGSWLAVNEHGLTLAIENGYTDLDDLAHAPSDGFTSRGLLLVSLADTVTSAGVLSRIEAQDLHAYRSFLLTVFEGDGSGLLMRWTRGRLSVERELAPLVPIVSSSFETDEVRCSRREVYRRMLEQTDVEPAELHLRYHASHLPRKGAFSTCMHRPEARTVSFSRVQVGAEQVSFHYVPHSPCRGRPTAAPVRIRRAGPNRGPESAD